MVMFVPSTTKLKMEAGETSTQSNFFLEQQKLELAEPPKGLQLSLVTRVDKTGNNRQSLPVVFEPDDIIWTFEQGGVKVGELAATYLPAGTAKAIAKAVWLGKGFEESGEKIGSTVGIGYVVAE
jgi:hypothetical protein